MRYAEATVTPCTHIANGIPAATVCDAIAAVDASFMSSFDEARLRAEIGGHLAGWH